MRRLLRGLIPIFAVALLAQWLAPIGAFRLAARAIADPAAVAPLCIGIASVQADAAAPDPLAPDPLRHDGWCCALCAVGHGGGPLVAAASQDFAIHARPHDDLIWPAAEQPTPPRRADAHAQARAPPVAAAI